MPAGIAEPSFCWSQAKQIHKSFDSALACASASLRMTEFEARDSLNADLKGLLHPRRQMLLQLLLRRDLTAQLRAAQQCFRFPGKKDQKGRAARSRL